MSWKKFLLGVGVGFAGAYILKKTVVVETISSEKALRIVKDAFKKLGPIEGSWIHMTPESFIKSNIDYLVFKGGISSSRNGEDKQHEFIVDAKTGTILEIAEI